MRMNRAARVSAVLLSICCSAALGACASGGGGGGDDAGPRRDPNLITRAELSEYTFPSTYDAIRRLRPRWLQSRGGGAPEAILDGTRLGGPDQLRSINVVDIVSIRYLSASDATTRYGTGFPNGAIEVRTR